MTWTELIDRLLVIQKANGYQKEWVVKMIESCGHPPKQMWRMLAKALGYSQYWADWRHLPGHENEEPDPGAINWVWELPIPGPPPLLEPIPRPVLKRKPVSAYPKP